MAYRNIHSRASQDLAALPTTVSAPAVVPPASPITFDMQSGSLIYTAPGQAPMKIPVIPGLISAMAVKLILFGGKHAGRFAVGQAKRLAGR